MDSNDHRQAGDAGKRGAVTIYDVARVAGVSSMTVSRVINEQKHVSTATREKVQAAIAELQFSPNAAALSLRSAMRIGLIYSNPESSNVGLFLMGAFRQSGELGCQLLVEPRSAHASDLAAIDKVLSMTVDGVILPPPMCDDPDVLARMATAGVPMLGFATADPRAQDSAVMIDDFVGAKLMTEHLLSLGHRDIAFIRGAPTHSPALRREEAFRAAMVAAGVPVRSEWVADGDFSYRSGLAAGQALLMTSDRPSAIFASNDDMAAAACAVAHGQSLKIGDDISICGFDDSPVATIIWPQLTTIRQPFSDMSALAVSILADQIRSARAGDPIGPVHRRVDVSLIDRASTGPCRRPS